MTKKKRAQLKDELNAALAICPRKFMSRMYAEAWNQDIKMDMHIKWAFEGLDYFGLKFIVVDKESPFATDLKAGLKEAIAHKEGKLKLRSTSIQVPEPDKESHVQDTILPDHIGKLIQR